MRFQPTENEVKTLRQFEKERKPLESLTDEDRFMMQFSKIERLMQKMTIMAFIGNFCESVQMLTPVRSTACWRRCSVCLRRVSTVVLFASPQQLHAVIAASVSIKSSQKLKKILEVTAPPLWYEADSRKKALPSFSYLWFLSRLSWPSVTT